HPSAERSFPIAPSALARPPKSGAPRSRPDQRLSVGMSGRALCRGRGAFRGGCCAPRPARPPAGPRRPCLPLRRRRRTLGGRCRALRSRRRAFSRGRGRFFHRKFFDVHWISPFVGSSLPKNLFSKSLNSISRGASYQKNLRLLVWYIKILG